MSLRRALGVVATVIAVASAGYAAAATLGPLGSDTLGAGSATVTGCDPNGVNTEYVIAKENVTSVTVSDIHSDCTGARLSLTLTDDSDASIASADSLVVPGGGSMSVDVSPDPEASAVTGLHVVVVGP